MPPSKPLTGYRVVDFSAVFAGPLCSRYLLDCGADVIKVEPPGVGDFSRGIDGLTPVFAHFNAGKRSIAIDLKQDRGQELVRRLISGADVLIENYRPGIMQRFGLDYASLRDAHPGLVYCSISGFGQTGPQKERAAYAPIVHAASGFDAVFAASQTNTRERPPDWEIMMADIITGSLAFGAIQTALIGRGKTGQGDYIDVSMMDAMMSLIPVQLQRAQMANPIPIGRYCPARTADGWMMLSIVSDKNMQGLTRVLKRPELLDDPRFIRGPRTSHIAELMQEVEQWSGTRGTEQCIAELSAAGVPCGAYEQPEDLFDHPQVLARQSFTTCRNDRLGEFLIQNLPAKFQQFDSSAADQVPTLGEDTDTILSEELALNAEEIAALRRDKTVG